MPKRTFVCPSMYLTVDARGNAVCDCFPASCRVCRKTCFECGKALLKAREKLDSIKPKLPARKLPAAPPSLPATPGARNTNSSNVESKFVSDDNRANIERWIKDSIASISPSIPPMMTGMRIRWDNARSVGRRISPTSAVCGDDDVAAYFNAEPLALGERHLSE